MDEEHGFKVLPHDATPLSAADSPSEKHKAAGEVPSSSHHHKRRRASRPLTRGSWQPPEPGSINSIIHGNPRERLYVPPPQWTMRHLHLLDIHFEQVSPPKCSLDKPTWSSLRTTLMGLRNAATFVAKENLVIDLLTQVYNAGWGRSVAIRTLFSVQTGWLIFMMHC